MMIPTTLVLVHYHPETPDDCPCFEDAIAILAVILGSFLGHLYSVRSPRDLGPSVWADGLLWGLATALCRFVMGKHCALCEADERRGGCNCRLASRCQVYASSRLAATFPSCFQDYRPSHSSLLHSGDVSHFLVRPNQADMAVPTRVVPTAQCDPYLRLWSCLMRTPAIHWRHRIATSLVGGARHL